MVVRVPDADDGVAALGSHGVAVRYLQRRDLGGGLRLDEADLDPIYGMPIALLATEMP